MIPNTVKHNMANITLQNQFKWLNCCDLSLDQQILYTSGCLESETPKSICPIIITDITKGEIISNA